MVKIICYGKEIPFNTKQQASDFLLDAIANTEGTQQDRYFYILMQVEDGKAICTDEGF